MRPVFLKLVCLFACFMSGAILGKHQRDPEIVLLSGIPSLDYFIADQSFSEIKNAKAVLDGLAGRFREEFRVEKCMQFQATGSAMTVDPTSVGNAPYPERMIQELESGVSEFSGTDEELALTEDLLCVLRADGLHDGWLQTYLAADPTKGIVAAYAHDAMLIAQRVERQDEVINGLRHVDSIPLDFRSNSQVQNLLPEFPALAKVDGSGQALAQQPHSP